MAASIPIPVPESFVCSGVCGLHWEERPSGRCLMCRDGDSMGWLCRGCHAGHGAWVIPNLHRCPPAILNAPCTAARGRFPGHVATEAGTRSDRGALLVELGTFAPPLQCTAHGAARAGGSLRYFCVTDNTSLCDACIAAGGAHVGHSVIPLARAAKACRSHILLLTGGIGAWPDALPSVSFDDVDAQVGWALLQLSPCAITLFFAAPGARGQARGLALCRGGPGRGSTGPA